jgi:hypothetical protein
LTTPNLKARPRSIFAKLHYFLVIFQSVIAEFPSLFALHKWPVRVGFRRICPLISVILCYSWGPSIKAPPMARGRKSEASSLTVVPEIPGQGRPKPPAGLDKLERRIWKAVVDALPAHWLDPAGQLVLRRLVAQAAIAERREARLRELRALDADGGEDAIELATMHATTAKSIAYLLGQLRATPRSRVVSRDAGPKVEQTPRFKPWEIKARA